jgi:hypothetical protein
MARKTVSLLPLIVVRLLIAAAIAGVLSVCSFRIERMKGFFKLSDGAGTAKIIPRRSEQPSRRDRARLDNRQSFCTIHEPSRTRAAAASLNQEIETEGEYHAVRQNVETRRD